MLCRLLSCSAASDSLVSSRVSRDGFKDTVSADAAYLWIRQGKIPAGCIVRIAGTVRVHEEQFEHHRDGRQLHNNRIGRRDGDQFPAPRTRQCVTSGGCFWVSPLNF